MVICATVGSDDAPGHRGKLLRTAVAEGARGDKLLRCPRGQSGRCGRDGNRLEVRRSQREPVRTAPHWLRYCCMLIAARHQHHAVVQQRRRVPVARGVQAAGGGEGPGRGIVQLRTG